MVDVLNVNCLDGHGGHFVDHDSPEGVRNWRVDADDVEFHLRRTVRLDFNLHVFEILVEVGERIVISERAECCVVLKCVGLVVEKNRTGVDRRGESVRTKEEEEEVYAQQWVS